MQDSPAEPREGPITESERDAAAAVSATPLSKWAIHRRLYDWVIGFAHKKHSTAALAALSFAESSFFPIPPDVLLMPMCLGNRKRAFWYATVCTVASVLGGIAGYAIGLWAMDLIGQPILNLFDPDKHVWARIVALSDDYGFLGIFIAAVSPIPYKVFTIAAGALEYSLLLFVIASVIGRGFRFFLEAGLMYRYGPKIMPFIDKYFNLLTIVFVVVLVALILLYKVL